MAPDTRFNAATTSGSGSGLASARFTYRSVHTHRTLHKRTLASLFFEDNTFDLCNGLQVTAVPIRRYFYRLRSSVLVTFSKPVTSNALYFTSLSNSYYPYTRYIFNPLTGNAHALLFGVAHNIRYSLHFQKSNSRY